MKPSREPTATYLAIVNPAAGGGRSRQRAPAVLAQLRNAGLEIEIRETSGVGDATRLARDAYAEGFRRFIACGGDGTCGEVLNGLAPHGLGQGDEARARLGILPLGTGNSFLREFTEDGTAHSIRALIEDRHRSCDVLRLSHAEGQIYFVNLLGFGFTANVTLNTFRGGYKRLGNIGYTLGVLHTLARMRYPTLPLRVDGGQVESDPLTFLCICNSRYTAGSMLMAPEASVEDGMADLIRVEPLGRSAILRAFPKIFRGTHIDNPAVSARAVRRIDFDVTEATDLMIDGEILQAVPRSLEVLPGALEVWA